MVCLFKCFVVMVISGLLCDLDFFSVVLFIVVFFGEGVVFFYGDDEGVRCRLIVV